MNTQYLTFYVVPSTEEGQNLGNLKTIKAAKVLAKKEGLSIIYCRVNDVDGETPVNGAPYMILHSDGVWRFLDADEDDFSPVSESYALSVANDVLSVDEPQPSALLVEVCDVLDAVAARAGVSSESPESYNAGVEKVTVDDVAREDVILEEARRIAEARFMRWGNNVAFTSPQVVSRYLASQLLGLQHEVFIGVMLDSQHRVIATVELAHGTIDGAAVYPREVVKAALAYNAAAVVFAHNHPSGVSDASQADRVITKRLVDALKLVDIRVLDHVIIGNGEFNSFAEKGWL